MVKVRQDARSHLLEADRYCLPGTAWGSYSREVNICGIRGQTADPREKGLGSEAIVVHLMSLDDLTVHESLHSQPDSRMSVRVRGLSGWRWGGPKRQSFHRQKPRGAVEGWGRNTIRWSSGQVTESLRGLLSFVITGAELKGP